MAALRVAVLATAGFSPFHFSVPCILFGSALPQPDLFHVDICALKPGPVISEMGLSITVEQGLDPLDQAEIIIVPYWHNPAEKPAQALLDKLVAAWQPGSAAQRSLDYVWALTYWLMQVCSISIVLPLTGNLSVTSASAFRRFTSTVMLFIPVTIV